MIVVANISTRTSLYFLSIAETYFPNANIVIDRFHVVRYITWALENLYYQRRQANWKNSTLH
ncbi:transposase [Eubacterium ventriosum]|uniref:transposase n=1 Tax=Eubacterium ventriosum TaxID=39496 RepID=UPI003520D359